MNLTPIFVSIWLACAPRGPSPEAPADPLSPSALAQLTAGLADDALGGRGTFEPGGAEAARRVAARFEALGLEAPEGGYLQEVRLWRWGWDAEASAGGPEGGEPWTPGAQFRPFPFSASGRVEAPVVFVGYGIVAPEHGWDDYAGLDLTGRWALALRHEPAEDDPASPFNGAESTDHATFATKARVARERGALGLLVVTDPLHHPGAEDLRWQPMATLDAPEDREAPPDEGFLALQISRAAAEGLLGTDGAGLRALQEAVDAGTRPSALSTPSPTLTVALRPLAEPRPETVHNVVARLPGRERGAEPVVVGAHYDHLGAFTGEGDTVFNGADDNASGTAGLMALAEALATSGEALRRDLVFVAFTAEEIGLLGSRAFVGQRLPPEQVAFMLNLDMIGRLGDQPLRVAGDAFTPGLGERLDELALLVDLELERGGFNHAGNSDHHPFHQGGAPALHLFTGLHEDYHQLGDHADKLDHEGMARVLQLALGLLGAYAEDAERPGRLHPLPWLDLTVACGPEGARVVEAGPDSPLQVGDTLVAVNGQSPSNPYLFGPSLSDLPPGVSAPLTVLRGGAEVEVPVLRPEPGYLGVRPRAPTEDEAAPLGLPPGTGIVLVAVVPGGPAAQGGLQAGDLVLAMDGEPVGPSSLGDVLARVGAGGVVRVLVSREGERVELEVRLGLRDGSR